ncbi:uncharacterized protein LOC107981663 [Nasonia vitripennis]|uniref:Uncharacterized protein n=1 Tax=Nasonia vitripennis TaxID=7425 RepID=A0A7M7IVS7_NASVI|nr:uncharacterized protein LOC107981663 [Nasonia vitripennis]
MERIRRLEEFENHEEFENSLELYEYRRKQTFVISDAHKLKKTDVNENQACIYKNVKFVCIYGKQRHTIGENNVRETSTIKNDCESFIYLRLSRDEQRLKILDLNLQHTNHELSEYVHSSLARNRKLNDKERVELLDHLLSLGTPIPKIQDEFKKVKNVELIPKDIYNYQRKFKNESDDTLFTAVSILKKIYNAEVDVYCELDDNNKQIFKGLYFSTLQMRNAFNSWPEVIFIDTMYNLLKRKLITLLLCVQDSMGFTRIIGVALLANLLNILKFVKKRNPKASANVNCFMTDKDLTKRRAIVDVFPGVKYTFVSFMF